MLKFLELQKAISEHSFKKGAVNPFFKSKYMTLDEIMCAILPILNDLGLVITQCTAVSDGKQTLVTEVFNADDPNERLTSAYLLSPKSENDPQAMGGALTYARRYALCSMLGIVADVDDDGNQASKKPTSKPVSKPTTTSIVDAKTLINDCNTMVELKDTWLTLSSSLQNKLLDVKNKRKAEIMDDINGEAIAVENDLNK